MALDGVVNVNSLFTLAVFVGLAFNPVDPRSTLVGTSPCAAGRAVAEGFVASHVYSFSSFLFSSLVASALKLAIRTAGDPSAHVNLRMLRVGILASAAGSATGCVFLTMALVDLVQVKLGALASRSWYTFAAVGPLVVLVPSALVIYMFVVLHAFAS
ncbi:hypothetical protein NMG60_11014541 [Bertholletia excelsa]